MKISHLTAAVSLTMLTISSAHAAGLERSQQPIAPLFEEGNYAELSYGYVSPDITGKDALGNKIDKVMDSYGMPGAAVKIAPTDNTALMLTYNQPWGVDSTYPKGNLLHNDLGSTEAHVDAKALGLTGGGKINDNIWLYGGLEYQTVSGDIQVAVPGKPVPTMYKLDFEDDSTIVPMAGVAFEKPEIALRAALTYRAPAKYNVDTSESVVILHPLAGVTPFANMSSNTKVEFPQSVSLDFQTGLSRKYRLLGMVNARWVEWSEFEVAPVMYAANNAGKPLASYDKDQYSVEVALAKQFTDKLAAEIRGAYDSGTGQPLSALGPYDATKSIALGAKYDVNDALTISGGVQYIMLEGGNVLRDEKQPAGPGNTVLEINDNNAFAAGIKVGYHF